MSKAYRGFRFLRWGAQAHAHRGPQGPTLVAAAAVAVEQAEVAMEEAAAAATAPPLHTSKIRSTTATRGCRSTTP